MIDPADLLCRKKSSDKARSDDALFRQTAHVGRIPAGRSAIGHRIMAEPLRVPPYVLIPRCASSCQDSVDIALFMLIVQKAAKKAGTGTNRRPKPGVAADRSQRRWRSR